MATTCAIYGRLSLDQNGNGVSVERQMADCRELAAKRDWTVVEEFRDDSRSAWQYNRKRPGWDAMLDGIRQERFAAVVVWHGDRLMRQPKDLEVLIDLARDHGLTIASPAGTRDLSNDDHMFITRIEVASACRESASTSRRVRRVREEEAQAGKRHGFIPYGWRDEADALVVKRIVVSLLAGESLRSLTLSLNADGVPAPRGGRWTSTQVRQVALRWSNAGLRYHLGQRVSTGDWVPLVSVEQQESVDRLLRDPKRKTNAGTYRRHLLSGVARCGVCGAPLRFADLKPRKVYRCSDKLCVSMRADVMDEFVLEVAQQRLQAPDAAALGDTSDEERSELLTRLGDLQRRKDELASDYADGVLDREQMRTASSRLSAQISAGEDRLRKIERRQSIDRTADLRTLSPERQRAALASLLVVVLHRTKTPGHVDVDRIEIQWVTG